MTWPCKATVVVTPPFARGATSSSGATEPGDASNIEQRPACVGLAVLGDGTGGPRRSRMPIVCRRVRRRAHRPAARYGLGKSVMDQRAAAVRVLWTRDSSLSYKCMVSEWVAKINDLVTHPLCKP